MTLTCLLHSLGSIVIAGVMRVRRGTAIATVAGLDMGQDVNAMRTPQEYWRLCLREFGRG